MPIRTYEDLWNGYWKAEFPELNDCTWPGTIPYFALTAGTTTGVTKYIPCSRAMLDANFRAAQDILFHHLLNRPISRVLGGKAFILGGSTDLREELPGIFSGDLSGIEANEFPGGCGPTPFHLEPWRSSLIGRRRLISWHGSRLRRTSAQSAGRRIGC